MSNISSLKWTLCNTCILSFEGVRDHHQEYEDFVASKDTGCFLCIWLWESHMPAPIGYRNSEKEPTFRISCLVVRGWDVYHTHFSIRCNWAPLAELKVSLRKLTSRQDLKGSIAKHVRLGDNLDPNIGSNQSLQKIQGWISSCQGKHEHCRSFHLGAKMFFPARIIDVTNASSNTIIVRDREEVMNQHEKEKRGRKMSCSGSSSEHMSTSSYPDYWTLSHRWGDPNKITQLLKTTESRLREGISLDELSPAFRDAILLVCRLGYRYIWIDSLCIFQDSTSDWHREVGSLVDIYRHSFCNISAISSSYNPAATGLFGRRRIRTRILYPFIANFRLRDQSGDVSNGSWLIHNKSIWDYEIERAPLSRRGWVVQERFLARRLVHFTRNQVYWECLECTHCEAEPKEKLLILDRERVNQTGNWNYAYPKLTMAKIRTSSTAPLPQGLNDAFTHKAWRAIVTKYTSCQLTKESDKLMAISGVAKTFGEFNGDTYLAGLWKDKIFLYLLWQTDGDKLNPPRRNGYAPSWSWASITGGVRFMDIGPGYCSLIKLVDARIVTKPPGGDPTSLLLSAELDLECAVCSFRCVNKEEIEMYNDATGRYIEHGYINDIFPDTLDIATTLLGRRGVCVPICEWCSPTTRFTNLLLLKQESGNRFKRIGVQSMRWNAPMLPRFEKWASETSCITLI
ncbi:heterokaryon incompatibility protein-domain-containing protein [Annulohypoxylon truncatum]|uniref:heterokaryon incompatibility protein-domain-containing protein n=1 Tax=Annulohypoxylon truncatum TaxID=327061 RepID=UPI002008C604|nr:heterokaryon incompatibility protein-domain-containing protein [Annulohypoxylon truncatum]KAI1213948.1 heterokaryon incompatibility protein-domain-containing protein [Annulohypoxylon truncatum]